MDYKRRGREEEHLGREKLWTANDQLTKEEKIQFILDCEYGLPTSSWKSCSKNKAKDKFDFYLNNTFIEGTTQTNDNNSPIAPGKTPGKSYGLQMINLPKKKRYSLLRTVKTLEMKRGLLEYHSDHHHQQRITLLDSQEFCHIRTMQPRQRRMLEKYKAMIFI